jgi:D-threo-aldose 1-dehydrogenase
MQTIPLADTGRHTTRLGFGCSSIMGATNRRDSLRLLESAYDAGIRHFDVAPAYGYGQAESCLADLLQRHRADITITTKYGIPPARRSPLIRIGRTVASPLIRHLPAIKQRLARAANAATHNPQKNTFTAAEAQASLQRSLTALRTDRIDLWLLHEPTAADLQDESLLRFLEDQTKQGTIGTFGIGSDAAKINSLLAERPAYCLTLQYQWSVLDAPIPPSPPFRIHHRALTTSFRTLHANLLQQKDLTQRWSQAVDADLTNPDTLAHLMLKASLVMNPLSIILFSSKDPAHIHANARVAADPTLEAPALRLYNLIQAEQQVFHAQK